MFDAEFGGVTPDQAGNLRENGTAPAASAVPVLKRTGMGAIPTSGPINVAFVPGTETSGNWWLLLLLAAGAYYIGTK
jgi:hypothetical protein